MRYRHPHQHPFHTDLTETWTELVALVRESEADQVRGLYLHRRPGADEGVLELRSLPDLSEILAEPGHELEATLTRLADQLRAGALTVDVADMVGLAITARGEHGRIMVEGAFTDGMLTTVTAHPDSAIEVKFTAADGHAREESPIGAAVARILDIAVGSRHDQVTRAIQDALRHCLREGLQAAFGLWEQEPGVYQARPHPELGQEITASMQTGTELEAALQRAAKTVRSRQRRAPKRPPRGFGWIRYTTEPGQVSRATGIAVLDGWVYFGSLRARQSEPDWTVFPRATAGVGHERTLVDALELVRKAQQGRPRS